MVSIVTVLLLLPGASSSPMPLRVGVVLKRPKCNKVSCVGITLHYPI
jgi:hypothetical protein